MTFLDSWPWRKFLAESSLAGRGFSVLFFGRGFSVLFFGRGFSALIAISLLASCAADETYTGTEHVRVKHNVSGQFEWAVQHYEAGEYKEAVKNFERLRKEGAEVPDYDLVSFYVGMSLYHLGRFDDAARELESFLRSNTTRQEGQDARLSLLLTYERLGRWKDIATLASETDKLTLFQNNRALLKLVWARALREQGEIKGAKAVLSDALPYLDKMGSSDRSANPFYADPDQDLWGRYHFTEVLVEEVECNKLGPKEIMGSTKIKSADGATKIKKMRMHRLYNPWLEGVTDCFRKAVTLASNEIFAFESPWSAPAEQSLSQGIDVFANKIQTFLKEESGVLNNHRALQKASSEHLYRLLGTLDERLKFFKDRGVNSVHLESLRKQLDRLLVSLSRPS